MFQVTLSNIKYSNVTEPQQSIMLLVVVLQTGLTFLFWWLHLTLNGPCPDQRGK